jgi:hypothetical protein
METASVARGRAALRGAAIAMRNGLDALALAVLWPLNQVLVRVRRSAFTPGAVLHVSYMVHIPWLTVNVLRAHGLKADYMAIGDSPVWNTCDFRVPYSPWPVIRVVQQMWWFWGVMAKYEIVHLHFMVTLTSTGWELPLLKKMGRKIVVNYRGCEARDREMNMRLHPDSNICEECDYWVDTEARYMCQLDLIANRRAAAARYGDLVLVTTPDMRDFMPDAIHFPFFAPQDHQLPFRSAAGLDATGPLRIVHATNHPGIEGTRVIREVLERLDAKGYSLESVFLEGVPHDVVIHELASADLAIGKMKMGYYANAQIESMMLGVPTVTFVRPEFMTTDLEESGFIICELAELEEVLEHYLRHPEELSYKRARARPSIEELHNNGELARRLIGIYQQLAAGGQGQAGESDCTQPIANHGRHT